VALILPSHLFICLTVFQLNALEKFEEYFLHCILQLHVVTCCFKSFEMGKRVCHAGETNSLPLCAHRRLLTNYKTVELQIPIVSFVSRLVVL